MPKGAYPARYQEAFLPLPDEHSGSYEEKYSLGNGSDDGVEPMPEAQIYTTLAQGDVNNNDLL
jgi:hypothetical protein